jgi:hypothetical protein
MVNESNSNFNNKITEELLDPYSLGVDKLIAPYRGSSIQKETYDTLETEDKLYNQFIIRQYGSYQNFLTQNKIQRSIQIFDPTIDYIIDATVITKDAAYKTDHLSSQETLMEILSGVCTVYFIKKTTGSSRRITCTLERGAVPSTYAAVRSSFFSPMAGDRIGVWDLNERKWKSFYMSSVYKFVRDDTTSLE